MNDSQVFVPNYPPPPIVQGFSQNSSNIQKNVPSNQSDSFSLYKDRLSSYLDSRKSTVIPKLSKNHSTKALKLGEVSKNLGHCFHLIQEITDNLNTSSPEAIHEQQWNKYISELCSKTKDLSHICSKLVGNDVRNYIHNLLRNRLTRRKRIKKRKTETKLLKQYTVNKRTIRTEKINMWIEKNAKKILEQRCHLKTKHRAEQMLMDVKNRKHEANKFILLLESLRELHSIRNRDSYVSIEANTVFNREINDLKMLWTSASNSYHIEEKNLRKFLHFTNSWEEWRDVCFSESTTEDMILTLWKKDDSLNRLIDIRNGWDQCVVFDSENCFGSSLPLCWAYPNPSPTNKWTIYMKQTLEN